MTKTLKLALAGCLGVLMVGGLPGLASARQDPSNQNIPSLQYESADVREALRALFHTVGVSYTIAPDVVGTVTVDLKNQTFETCLQAITRQVDATYRIDSGIFQIVKREDNTVIKTDETVTGVPTSNKIHRTIHILHADPALIAMLLSTKTGTQRYNGNPEITSLGRMMTGSGGGGGFGGGSSGGIGGGIGGSSGGIGGGGGGIGGGRGGL